MSVPALPPLARTRGGDMIHRADCRHARGGYPWKWAEGRDPAEVQEVVWFHGYGTCKDCKPFDLEKTA